TIIHFLWQAADTDDDQRISRAEMDAVSEGLTTVAFGPWDGNGDDYMTYEESLANIQFFAPIFALATIDTNSSLVFEFGELDGFMSAQTFAQLDRNNNGVLDCGDVEDNGAPEGEQPEGEDPAEGEP